MSYQLIAEISQVQGELATIRAALQQLAQATRQEPGCITFEIKERKEQPGTFFLWESWRDKTALEQHFEQPHTRNYLELGYTDVVSITELAALEAPDAG